ncbi:MAG: hypothetical protein IKE66_11535 [Hyphomicrobium sp.]|nr:hypothetical protein [Hyphomicrobium sp.]
MYLLAQIWWYLLIAFLLGVLIGYFIWRFCSRPALEARVAQSRKDMADRLALLEAERAAFAAGPDTGHSRKHQPKT